MASQFPAGAAAGDIFTTGAGDTYQFLNNRWQITAEKDHDPTFDIYSRVNSLKWGSNAKIYENVFDAIADGTISEYGGAWSNTTSHAGTNYWNNANIMQLNTSTTDPTVASTAIAVEPGYSMVWVRVLNDGNREIQLDLYFDEGNVNGSPIAGTYVDEEIHYSNAWQPQRWHPYNSSFGPNRDNYQHLWLPLALPNANGGTAYLVARNHAFSTPDYWISGIALTANPWGFSRMQAITAHRGIRIASVGGVTAERAGWFGGFEGTHLASRGGSGSAQPIRLRFTSVDNGVDKVIHVVGCGDNSSHRPQLPLFVNNTEVSVMPAALDPFVWHILNNNHELRVTSYKVPAALVGINQNHMEVEFKCNALKNSTFYFSEILCCDLRA